MTSEPSEQQGTVIRVPTVRLGAMELHEVGFLGTAPAHGQFKEQVKAALFWRLWGRGAPN